MHKQAKRALIIGNITKPVQLARVVPPDVDHLYYEPAAFTGKLVREYALKSGLPATKKNCGRIRSEEQRAQFYERILLEENCDVLIVFYHEFTYALAYAYGAAKARNIRCTKRKVPLLP